MLGLNFSVDGAIAMAAYKHPFDLIFERVKLKEWSPYWMILELSGV
jgi:hypothetical protein